MNRKRIVNALLAGLAAGTLLLAGGAWGQEPAGATGKNVSVPHKDLDPTDEAGAEALYHRLSHAADLACEVDLAKKRRFIQDILNANHCARNQLSAAVKRLDNEWVTRIHNGY